MATPYYMHRPKAILFVGVDIMESAMTFLDRNRNQDDLDNHANQLNPNNDEYYNSRDDDPDDHYDDKDSK